jgi:hypothetical protein
LRCSQPCRHHHVYLGHADRQAEINQARHAVALFRYAAWHDPGKMRQVRLDVQRDAVQRHPLAHANTDGGDLVLVAVAFVGTPHPDADAVVAPLAAHIECSKRLDDPLLQGADEHAHVRLSPVEVEHHISHALAGPVIGELSAAADLVYREPRLDQVFRPGAGAGGVERGMLQQPDLFGRAAVGDRGHPLVHGGECRLVRHRGIAHAPLHRRLACSRRQVFRGG